MRSSDLVAILVPSAETSTAYTRSLCPLNAVTFSWLCHHFATIRPIHNPLFHFVTLQYSKRYSPRPLAQPPYHLSPANVESLLRDRRSRCASHQRGRPSISIFAVGERYWRRDCFHSIIGSSLVLRFDCTLKCLVEVLSIVRPPTYQVSERWKKMCAVVYSHTRAS